MEKGEDGVWGAATSDCPPHPGVTGHGVASGPPGSESGSPPLRASGQSCPSLRKRCHFKLEEGALSAATHAPCTEWLACPVDHRSHAPPLPAGQPWPHGRPIPVDPLGLVEAGRLACLRSGLWLGQR